IEGLKPEVVVGLGNLPLWALAGHWGISNWRGSEMVLANGYKFVPSLTMTSIQTQWANRAFALKDWQDRIARRLRNGFVKPVWDFEIHPTLPSLYHFIDSINGDVAADIETSNGKIVCLGLATSSRKAMCIPFQTADGPYWDPHEYVRVLEAIDRLVKNKKVNWIGQNWNYDAQYFDQDLYIRAPGDFDTYIGQSVLYPGVARDLGFLSSMYCDWHSYWKEDGKDWGNIKDYDKEFIYNCRDCCATWEIKQAQKKLLIEAGLLDQFEERMRYSHSVYTMMRQGVIRDPDRTSTMIEEVSEAIQTNELGIAEEAGTPINFDSPKQVSELFYKQFGCTPILKRGTATVTT
ncbi:MAG: hypothetical protein ACREQ5_37855, partial [Candidatus Dormibacteria bacterium]